MINGLGKILSFNICLKIIIKISVILMWVPDMFMILEKRETLINTSFFFYVYLSCGKNLCECLELKFLLARKPVEFIFEWGRGQLGKMLHCMKVVREKIVIIGIFDDFSYLPLRFLNILLESGSLFYIYQIPLLYLLAFSHLFTPFYAFLRIFIPCLPRVYPVFHLFTSLYALLRLITLFYAILRLFIPILHLFTAFYAFLYHFLTSFYAFLRFFTPF